ncbi:MAG TPA: hypothetical protein VGQ83_38125 [Polyangia bacterium]|jgi:hypothetical protein
MTAPRLTYSGKAYFDRLLQLGLYEKTAQGADISPDLRPLMEAMHHVLAGGKVEIQVVQPGVNETIADLTKLLESARQEVTTVNQLMGEELAVPP